MRILEWSASKGINLGDLGYDEMVRVFDEYLDGLEGGTLDFLDEQCEVVLNEYAIDNANHLTLSFHLSNRVRNFILKDEKPTHKTDE